MRSLAEPPGLKYSTFASTVARDAVGDAVELDEGGVADEVGHALGVTHDVSCGVAAHQRRGRLSGVVEESAGALSDNNDRSTRRSV